LAGAGLKASNGFMFDLWANSVRRKQVIYYKGWSLARLKSSSVVALLVHTDGPDDFFPF
jgi:hypothetical protein